MSWVLPVGFNFADGVTTLPVQPAGAFGTPTVVGTPLPTAEIYIFVSGAQGPVGVEEPPGSPHLERAEQCTCSHTLRMTWFQCVYYFTVMPRGAIVNDSAANVWRILSCDIVRNEGTMGTLSYVMESISFDSPPDDFQLNEVSLDLYIMKHPRYSWALLPYLSDASTYSIVGDTKVYYTKLKEALIRSCQNYLDSPFFPSADQINGNVQNTILSQITQGKYTVTVPNPNYNPAFGLVSPTLTQQTWNWDGYNASLVDIPPYIQNLTLTVTVNLGDPTNPIAIALAATKELLSKLWRQEDTPYIAAYEVNWTQYFFAPVYLNPGGYIEDPRDVVPQYFISPNNDGIIPRGKQTSPYGGDMDSPPAPGQSTIFDKLTTINPQCYSTTGRVGGPLAISSLRKSDHYDYERTWFKVYHHWLVAPIGKWDADLYSGKERPQDANGYNQLPTFFGQT